MSHIWLKVKKTFYLVRPNSQIERPRQDTGVFSLPTCLRHVIYSNYLFEPRFFDDFWFREETNFCAGGGTATAPLKTIDSASSFFPYTLSLASLSGRTVEPSSEIPAKSPRDRE